MTPQQFTTADGSLIGLVNGVNTIWSFQPYPLTLQYSPVQGTTGLLFFRNGLLQDDEDYIAGIGYFAVAIALPADTFTAEMYASGPTKLRLGGTGLTFTGDNSHLRLSPLNPTFLTDVSFLLFRNGQLLTAVADYTTNGFWITLAADQVILPEDTFLALIGMGGVTCSTVAGSITGAINGANALFTLPFAFATALLFRNGQLLTVGQDYIRQGTQQVVLLGDEIPIPGDTLTAQVYATGGPTQITTVDGSLVYPTATESILFRNGLFMTQPLDGATVGNQATLIPFQVPLIGDVVTLEAWTPDSADPAQPPLNLPQPFSTNDGSLIGATDGVNNIFTVATDSLVTEFLLFYNGLELTSDVDYSWDCTQPTSAGPWATTITMKAGQNPKAIDVLTAEVFTT